MCLELRGPLHLGSRAPKPLSTLSTYCYATASPQHVVIQPIQSATYEDDLDLLVVTQINQCLDDDHYTAQVHLHDNQTGNLIKTIDLVEKWDTVG